MSFFSPFYASSNKYSGDADAENFISVTGTTNDYQIYGVNYLVWGLKNYGLWNKMQAVYPFTGPSTESYASYKYNLIDPQDTDAAFRLTFSNVSRGAITPLQPGATGGFADTKYIPNTHGSLNDQHIAFYSLTNGNSAAGVEMGAAKTNGNLTLRLDNGTEFISGVNSSEATFSSPHPFNDEARGLFIASRTSSADFQIYRNGVLGGTGAPDSNDMAEVSVYLLARHDANGNASGFSIRSTSFASIGQGLTADDAKNYNTVVQNFLKILGRPTY